MYLFTGGVSGYDAKDFIGHASGSKPYLLNSFFLLYP